MKWLGSWKLVGVFTSQSGQPYTVNTSIDVNRDGNLTDRIQPRDVAAETPGLGDQDHTGLHALERDLDLPEHVDPQDLREVEPEPVDPVGLDQVDAAVDDEPFRHRRARADVVAAAAPVGQ